jgi:hypothetical protein
MRGGREPVVHFFRAGEGGVRLQRLARLATSFLLIPTLTTTLGKLNYTGWQAAAVSTLQESLVSGADIRVLNILAKLWQVAHQPPGLPIHFVFLCFQALLTGQLGRRTLEQEGGLSWGCQPPPPPS